MAPSLPQNPDDRPDASRIQARIDELQSLYHEWAEMQPRLEAARKEWQRSIELMERLSAFYFDGEYLDYREAIDNGLPVNLHTRGEYSIMSEDTLWNAIHDHQSMAWQRLRSAIEVLDREGNGRNAGNDTETT
ncbi:MAG: DUF4298 domain-containing protein [Lautropia sp.]|nr:DUF4298 domain-containing protein [Lautropia sp.]